MKEFEKLVTTYEKDADFHLDAALYGEIEDFIEQAITEARKEVIEEIRNTTTSYNRQT